MINSFPRALRALDLIQKNVFSKQQLEDEAGDYNMYAREVENLKLDANLYALEEFGIPLQTVEKLKDLLEIGSTLDEVIVILKRISLDNKVILPFERDILAKAQKNL